MRTGPTGLVRIAVERLEDRCTPATFTVTNFTDWDETIDNTLPWAVAKANKTVDLDLIIFDIGLGKAKTIESKSTLTIGYDLIIQGPNTVGSSITLTGVKPFLFAGVPAADPGLPGEPPPPSEIFEHQILGVRFEGCVGVTGSNGGAVEISGYNHVTVRNCAFIENKSGKAADTNQGGAVYVDSGGKLVVGGTSQQQPVDNGTFSADQTVFLRNEAVGGDGGAIASLGVVVLETAWFQGNKAGESGGAIDISGSQGEIQMPASTSSAVFKQNKALDGNGGGININKNSGGNSTLYWVSFSENEAAADVTAAPNPGVGECGWGGGVNAGGGTLTITNGSFSNNTAGAYNAALNLFRGGAAALNVIDSHVTLVGVAFDTNNKTTTGEAVEGVNIAPTGWLTIGTGCTFNKTSIFQSGKLD